MEGGFMPLAFHPGGRVAATLDASRALVRLVEVETGRVLATLEPPEPTRPIAWPSAPTAATSPRRRPTSGCTSGTSRDPPASGRAGAGGGTPGHLRRRPAPPGRPMPPRSTASRSSGPTRRGSGCWRSANCSGRGGSRFERWSSPTSTTPRSCCCGASDGSGWDTGGWPRPTTGRPWRVGPTGDTPSTPWPGASSSRRSAATRTRPSAGRG